MNTSQVMEPHRNAPRGRVLFVLLCCSWCAHTVAVGCTPPSGRRAQSAVSSHPQQLAPAARAGTSLESSNAEQLLQRKVRALSTAISWGTRLDASAFSAWLTVANPESSSPLPVVLVDPQGAVIPFSADEMLANRVRLDLESGLVTRLRLITQEARAGWQMYSKDPAYWTAPPETEEGVTIQLPVHDPCADLPAAGLIPLGVVAAMMELPDVAAWEPGDLREQLRLVVPAQTRALFQQELSSLRVLARRDRGWLVLTFEHAGRPYAAFGQQIRHQVTDVGGEPHYENLPSGTTGANARSVFVQMLDDSDIAAQPNNFDFDNPQVWELLTTDLTQL